MKTIALFVVLALVAGTSVADDLVRQVNECQALTAQIRPSTDEGEKAQQYLDDGEKAYRDCRGANLPLDIRVKALLKYAMTSDGRGRGQEAIAKRNEAIDLLDKTKGAEPDLLIEALDQAAMGETLAGLPSDAKSHAKRALELRQKQYGARSVETVEGLINLAMVHATFNELSESEVLVRDAVRIAEKTCTAECDALAKAYSAMKTLYKAQGNEAEARRYSEMAIAAVPSKRSGGSKE